MHLVMYILNLKGFIKMFGNVDLAFLLWRALSLHKNILKENVQK